MNVKELRDFIKSHEMRYFVSEAYTNLSIRKAFKVDINGAGEKWVYFHYNSPILLSSSDIKHNLFKTSEEAKARAKYFRTEKEKKEAAELKEKMAKFNEVTEYLKGFSLYRGFGVYDDFYRLIDVKPFAKDFVKEIRKIYSELPKTINQKSDADYIDRLERYIKYGTFETQGMAFRKEQIVNIKYGKGGAIQIELVNGTTIIPVSENLTRLLEVVFGQRDGWYYTNIEYPKGERDETHEQDS